MLKKVAAGVLVLVLALGIGLFVWARAVLSGDGVRTALSAQLSKALGQPVHVGSVSASIYPRVSVNLGEVAIGDPAKIQVATLHLGTDFRALLSRRIEHARVELSGAHIALPLPPFTFAAASSSASSKPPVELVSIDAIVLSGVEITSGGRTLKADVEVMPDANGMTIRRFTIAADKTALNVTGRITDLSGPVGSLTMKAGALDVDQLLAFANDFASGSGMASASTSGRNAPPARRTGAAAGASAMNIAMALTADRATMGGLTIDSLAGTARLTPAAMTLEPIRFGVFGGGYSGSMVFSLGDVPDLRLNAAVSGVDMATATAFAGTPGLITGKLSGKLALDAHGMDAPAIMRTARGTARVDVTNGTIRNLGLVRAVVIATSGRTDVAGAASAGAGSRDEPFTTLGTTLAIANGSAATEDLRFESKDVLLSAAGTMRLDGSAIDLAGQLQLSDALSQQAGRDLVRYTQQGGRVTVPATITGSAEAPRVRLDLASMAKRAAVNRASEEAQKAVKKGLSNLLKK